ncbi:voltage-dependent anion channel-domain-containing protein [Vararia minispora EC-137]|uniref:Voltage-dependent anion channel-domain-containing protein n=1 Tax=Vararia minispora EC-137 TaxID=1314806 RepID=A0ACB8QZI7_9AGAM|nr:voltage-dependent anion channel-domain-containing protein [Vararia minispora EC-137]
MAAQSASNASSLAPATRSLSAGPSSYTLPALVEEPEPVLSLDSKPSSQDLSPTATAFEDHHPARPRERRVTTIARRIHGWSWQAFPIGMGTSAVYVTMSGLRQRSSTLRVVETIFFFLNIAIFLINVSTLVLQAILYPQQARRLVTDSNKNIFIPLVVLSYATIIIGIINYGVTPGVVEEELAYVLFWIYVVAAVGLSFPLLMIWYNEKHDITKFTPAWMFFMFPMMLVGVVAFNTLRTMNPADSKAVGVLFLGYFFQGIGFFVTMFYICIYFLRIMMTGFMDGHQANGAFVAVGPPGFTALALINLGSNARTILPQHGLISETAGEVWYAASVLTALMLYGLAVFLVIFGALPYWFKLHKHLHEILGCWALTFPNVGWIASTGALGNALNIPGLFDVQIVFVIAMAFLWLILVAFTAVAFKRGLILIAKPEDVLDDERRRQEAKEMV